MIDVLVIYKTEKFREEFQDITDEDVEATFSRQHDFWNKLEDEWKEMAERNKETGEHPWLDDFEEVFKY